MNPANVGLTRLNFGRCAKRLVSPLWSFLSVLKSSFNSQLRSTLMDELMAENGWLRKNTRLSPRLGVSKFAETSLRFSAPRTTAMIPFVVFESNSGRLTQASELVKMRPRLLKLLASQRQRFLDRVAIRADQGGVSFQEFLPFFASHVQVYAKERAFVQTV